MPSISFLFPQLTPMEDPVILPCGERFFVRCTATPSGLYMQCEHFFLLEDGSWVESTEDSGDTSCLFPSYVAAEQKLIQSKYKKPTSYSPVRLVARAGELVN